MTKETDVLNAACRAGPLAWVVPGALRQLTGGYLYDARIVDGLRAKGWRVGVVNLRSRRWPLDFFAGRRLVAALARERWGAVVVDELAHPALATALAGGRLRRAVGAAPLILLVHHLRCSEPASPVVRAVAMLMERPVLRSADLVVCTSETTARTVRRLAGRGVPVKVVRPGCDTRGVAPTPRPPADLPRSSQDSGAARPWGPGIPTAPCAGEGEMGHAPPSLSKTDVKLRLLLVGHWTPRKGILDALAAVARVGPNVTLDLVGEHDRDLRYAARVWAALRDPMLAGRVTVHGRISAGDLAARYAQADALVLPSTHEGYGMVLAEALAAGLPIVATRVGAVPEVVRDGCEAELVPAGDVQALVQAIERLAAEPEERQRRAWLARERAEALPWWSASVSSFEAHLRGLLARRQTGS